jgi:KipI family sensor histidine kinase inhibitor
MFPTFAPCGDSALLVTLGDRIDLALNRRVHALARRLDEDPLPGLVAAVPGYTALLVHYDPLLLDYERVLAWAQAQTRRVQAADDDALPPPRRVEVPTLYGGEHGPDLDFVAAHCGLPPEEVVRRHTARDYPVYLIGFAPGFPYLGGLDESIAAPRLPSPRLKVPAGSVGIAGAQTGIYSVDSPGGWRLIGWTPLKLFDPARQPASLLAPGDLVRFVAQHPVEDPGGFAGAVFGGVETSL